MKQIAIIASTASGKSKLSLELAKDLNSVILSLDSLSIYKYIDIASAKPTKEELNTILHFGIDEIYPDEKFNVMKFIDIYKKAKQYCQKNGKNLIIVGGSSFYLKSMIDGISYMPTIKKRNILKAKELVKQKQAYKFLQNLDGEYSKNIKQNDSYRLEKALSLYFETGIIPSKYFKQNKKIKLLNNLKIFQIEIDKDILKENIANRTKQMIKNGLIDEVIFLEKKYPRNLPPLKSIGLKETFLYLDGIIDKNRLFELICNATNQLAKRQRTFNKNQFKSLISGDKEYLKNKIKQFFDY